MYIIFSDIHLGDKHSNSNLPILFTLLENFDKNNILILNGDIIDFSKALYFDERHITFFNILKKFKKVIYLEGNHDWFLSGLKNIFNNIYFQKEVILNLKNKIIKIFHGHQYDYLISKWPWFVTILVLINDWVYKLTNIDFQHLFYKYVQKIFLNLRIKKITRLEPQANILITGHLHFPCKKFVNDIEYYNSGDWIFKKNLAYITINNKGDINLVKII